MLLEVIQELRKVKKVIHFFEMWWVLNFENACAGLLNFDDVLERSSLVIFIIAISSLLLCSFPLFCPIFYMHNGNSIYGAAAKLGPRIKRKN